MGCVLVLVGPTGTGKDTLTRLLMRRSPFLRIPQVTTRPLQPQESEAGSYIFVTEAEFAGLEESGELWNSVQRSEGRYGLLRSGLDEARNGKALYVAHLVPDYAVRLKKEMPDHTVVVFIRPPGEEIQRARLQARGEPEEVIARRLADVGTYPADFEDADLVLENREGRLEEALVNLLRYLYRNEILV